MSLVKSLSGLVFCLVPALSLYGQTILFPGLEGVQLQEALRASYRTSVTLTLSQAKDTLYSLIENDQDSVRGVYSGYTLHLPDGVDASQWLFMNGSGINIEHVFPQSKGAAEGLSGHSDMHHLYPSRVAVNEARASYPFAEIPDNTTTTWFRNDVSMQSIPSTDIDAYSEFISGAFEPRESVKGNIARAVFYFYTMYQDDADAADPNFFASQRTTLCQWHLDDAIDDAELERSARVAPYQEGKDNPFVLDCTAALRAWCPEFEGCNTSGIALGENDAFRMSASAYEGIMTIHFIAEDYQAVKIAVFDLMGRLQFYTRVSVPGGTSDFALNSQLSPGIYAISGIIESEIPRQHIARCIVH